MGRCFQQKFSLQNLNTSDSFVGHVTTPKRSPNRISPILMHREKFSNANQVVFTREAVMIVYLTSIGFATGQNLRQFYFD